MAALSKIRSVVTFLELRKLPEDLVLDPERRPISRFERVERIPLHFYRYLYDEIGRAHAWVSRSSLTDTQLRRVIHHPCTHVHVLYVEGAPAGFVELNYRRAPDMELTFLGLVPDFIGRGWGRYLMTSTLIEAHKQGVRRVRLQTCTLDHAHALPLYKSFGFEPQKLQTIELAVPEDRLSLIGRLAGKAS